MIDREARDHLAPVMLNQLARYGPAIAFVDEVAPRTVLEVGSGSEGLARFRGEAYEITVCDRDFSDYGAVVVEPEAEGLRRVEGDVTDLQFADGEFDVVLALDLLEHVAPEDRGRALREMARVSSRRTIVGCPCGKEALRSDSRLATLYDLLPRRQRPRWLQEHLDHGFPEGEQLQSVLSEFGRVRLHPNERLREHLMVSVCEAIPLVGRGTLKVAATLESGLPGRSGWRAWQGRALAALRGHDRGTTYRQMAVLDR